MSTKGLFQPEVNSGIRASAGFPNYDIFNDLNHQKPRDWGMASQGPMYDSSSHANPLHGNIDVSPSVLVQQGYSSTQQPGHSRDASLMGKSPFSLGEGLEHSNLQNGGQHFNPLLAGNSTRVKSESVPDASSQTNLFPDHYGQDDLMSALLKQVTHLILCSFF
jgi:two-component response regulator (ARR-B family)